MLLYTWHNLVLFSKKKYPRGKYVFVFFSVYCSVFLTQDLKERRGFFRSVFLAEFSLTARGGRVAGDVLY